MTTSSSIMESKNSFRSRQRHESMATSLQSQEIIDAMHPETGSSKFIFDICRGETLTDTGKRLQMLKILSLTLFPILGLWVFTVYNLSYNIQGKSDIEQTQYAVKFSVEIGIFLDRIQRERDMSVLYLSILGPQTKTFLMNEYLLTDQAIDKLSDWPVNSDSKDFFQSKQAFKIFLQEHRRQLDPNNYDFYVEMNYYNTLISHFVEWMHGAIKESNQASIWKILVAYQKIVTSMEHVGNERSLGTVFYVDGGFPTQTVYENYNSRVNNFKANYRSAVLYSHIVDPIFQSGVTRTGTNLTSVIQQFRHQMQNTMSTDASMSRGQYWFDNMTLYLDTLLIVQQDLANLINGELQGIINTEKKNLVISACFLVIVFLMCPLVIYTVEALTNDIQRYSIALVLKTKDLSKEQKKIDGLLTEMMPIPIADTLKQDKSVVAEYYKSVTILFSEIDGFNGVSSKICADCTPSDILKVLNRLCNSIDYVLVSYNVYKVETINDCYMVASGLPTRIGNKHSAEIANLSLDLVEMMHREQMAFQTGYRVDLRIGISTGPCMAGVVGRTIPRYCLFGDTVNKARSMKCCGIANYVHVSHSTYESLKKHANFVMKDRGIIAIKGMGKAKTYWLVGRRDENGTAIYVYNPDVKDNMVIRRSESDTGEVPGEIEPYQGDILALPPVSPSVTSSLNTTLDPKSIDDVTTIKKKDIYEEIMIHDGFKDL